MVKGGEDLRNDERIQQLFTVMNKLLASNQAAESKSSNEVLFEDEAQLEENYKVFFSTVNFCRLKLSSILKT